MSSRLYAMVWSRYPNGGSEMLLALCLADQACDDGTYIAPNIVHLAKKTRQTRMLVERQLLAMINAGWLAPMEPGSALFRISAEWIGGADVAPELKADRRADGRRIPNEWQLPKPWGDWALKKYPAWTADFVRQVATNFHNHWKAASGQNARKLDWEATWQNWCAKEPAVPPGLAGSPAAAAAASGEWWMSNTLIDAKGAELGLSMLDGEIWPQWRNRVYVAAGDGPWLKHLPPSTINQGFKSAGQLAGNLKHSINQP